MNKMDKWKYFKVKRYEIVNEYLRLKRINMRAKMCLL